MHKKTDTTSYITRLSPPKHQYVIPQQKLVLLQQKLILPKQKLILPQENTTRTSTAAYQVRGNSKLGCNFYKEIVRERGKEFYRKREQLKLCTVPHKI